MNLFKTFVDSFNAVEFSPYIIKSNVAYYVLNNYGVKRQYSRLRCPTFVCYIRILKQFVPEKYLPLIILIIICLTQ